MSYRFLVGNMFPPGHSDEKPESPHRCLKSVSLDTNDTSKIVSRGHLAISGDIFLLQIGAGAERLLLASVVGGQGYILQWKE